MVPPEYRPFRPSEVQHPLADPSKARELLGYAGSRRVREGLEQTTGWYVERARGRV